MYNFYQSKTHAPMSCSLDAPLQEVIASVVSTELFQKYTTLNLEQFVSEYSGLGWCPHPGCGQAMAAPKIKNSKKKKEGLNIWCSKGHAFCW